MTGERKGIVLAGGRGTRLYPGTVAVNKQLLVVYDKPMIYYPVSVLMLMGIREIAIISDPAYMESYRRLLGDGSRFGIKLEYLIQHEPRGLADAFLVARDFLNGFPSALVLGDNIFHGMGLTALLRTAGARESGATVFSYQVTHPEQYGIVELDETGKPVDIVEKPTHPKSRLALTGLYLYDGHAPDIAASLSLSPRGELEITDLNKVYLRRNCLEVQPLGRGTAWFDAGTFDDLLDASNYIGSIERRQGIKIGCLEEIAFRNRWFSRADLEHAAAALPVCQYRSYLAELVD